MAGKTINPEAQAAPYLGDSSHDPIEFVRRHNLAKFQVAKEQKAERDANNAEALKRLLVDVKGWEDQKGFEEIMGDRQKILDTFITYSRKGMNLGNPKTTEEHVMYKGIGDALERLKQKIGAWDQQKKVYDFYSQELNKPGAEEKMDVGGTINNVMSVLNENSILNRGDKLKNLFILKPDVNSVNEYTAKNKDRVYKVPSTQESVYNPESGLTTTVQKDSDDPKEQEKVVQSLRDVYRTAPDEVKKGLKAVRQQYAEADKRDGLDVISDEDYYAQFYNPKYKEKLVNKLTKSGGDGLSISVFGQPAKITPGEQRSEPLVYGDRTYTSAYKFFSKSPFKIPVGNNMSTMFNGQSWDKIENGGDVEAELLYFDSQRDEFIFRTTQPSNIAPYIPNNSTIAVPREVFGKESDNLPLKTSDGKVKKLMDVFGPLKVVKKTIGGKDYSVAVNKPYIPKGKK